MNEKEIDSLLKLLLRLEKVSTIDDIKRTAKSLFMQLSKYRFSTPDNLPTIKNQAITQDNKDRLHCQNEAVFLRLVF